MGISTVLRRLPSTNCTAKYVGFKGVFEVQVPRLYRSQQLETARSRIRELPERPPKPKAIPLSQLVKELREEIDAAVKRNSDLTQIVEVLREVNVEITETTLRSYLRKPRKPATGTPRAKPRKALGTAPATKTGTKAVPMPSAEDR